MPSKYSSSTKYISLALLFHSEDRSNYGNAAVFKPLNNELNSKADENIYIHCISILGDNLGQNSMLGFVESFSSNYYCRICKAYKVQCQSLCHEVGSLLRTPENYESDCALNNYKLTGIKEHCIWNYLEGYDFCLNTSLDVMHDLYEGACIYVMTEILEHFIYKAKSFTLDDRNFRLRVFDYGKLEASNKPPPIKEEQKK